MDPNNNQGHNPNAGPDNSISGDPLPPFNEDNVFWGMVDSWMNDDPTPLQQVPLFQSDDHHEIDGGGEGRDMGVQGMQLDGVATVNMGPQDQQQEQPQVQQQEQSSLQVVWPSVPNSDTCASCEVLREIIFTNGAHTTKLDIHGKVGFIAHAIRCLNYGLATSDDHVGNYQMLDFSTLSFEEIKAYLKGYVDDHRQNGYIMLQGPLSMFYETICVGYDWQTSNLYNMGVGRSTFERGESSRANIPEEKDSEEDNQPVEPPRTELSIQRERVKKMTIKDFAPYFYMTINNASKELRLCATVIKKKLRAYKINRWPYRKVNSIQRKLIKLIERKGSLYKKLIKVSPERVHIEIQILQHQLHEILRGNLIPEEI